MQCKPGECECRCQGAASSHYTWPLQTGHCCGDHQASDEIRYFDIWMAVLDWKSNAIHSQMRFQFQFPLRPHWDPNIEISNLCTRCHVRAQISKFRIYALAAMCVCVLCVCVVWCGVLCCGVVSGPGRSCSRPLTSSPNAHPHPPACVGPLLNLPG